MHQVQGAVGGIYDTHRRHSLRLRISLPVWASPCGGAGPLSPRLSGGFLSLDTARIVTPWTGLTVSRSGTGGLRGHPPAGAAARAGGGGPGGGGGGPRGGGQGTGRAP